jgi:hypothetical protein
MDPNLYSSPDQPSAPEPAAPLPGGQPTPQLPGDLGMDDKKPSIFANKIVLVIGGLLVVLIIVIIIAIFMSGGKESNTEATTAGNELNTLQIIVNYGRGQGITSENTIKVTVETSIITASHKIALDRYFSLPDIPDISKSPPAYISSLETAKANGNLETAFKQQLQSQLRATYTALEALKNRTENEIELAQINQAMKDMDELSIRISR